MTTEGCLVPALFMMLATCGVCFNVPDMLGASPFGTSL